MFRLEKVFQNDDSGYNFFVNFTKTLFLFLTVYCFSILNKNSIYDIFNYNIYLNSNYYFYSIFVTLSYFFFSISLSNKTEYKKNIIFLLKEDYLYLLISNILTFAIFSIFNFDFLFQFEFIFLIITIVVSFILIKIYFDYLYNNLVDKNIIQKNVMLVGSYEEIKKVLSEHFEKIYVFKCCMITNLKNLNLKIIKSEIKFPIFNEKDDIRSILEYHSLGQIWILNGNKDDKKNIFSQIIKFSVDTLNVKLEKSFSVKDKKLLANKFEYEFYEWSRFYGISLFLKILIDKFFSIIFLILASPILLFSIIAIYIEDGFPILFTQNRTGWDGRRFKIYKIRSLKNKKYDPTRQVSTNDDRKLKVGNFIRRFSIDEMPQLYNVLKGEMSLVGPRPHPVSLDLNYLSIYESFLTRYRCNPGLTGWAQINGLRGATPNPEAMKKRMEYDLWYLNNWTIFLDIYIIIKTFYAVFKYKGD